MKNNGSVLLISILILAGFLLTAVTASKLVYKGLEMGRVQANSTKAYFAGEAGAEKSLWEVRKGGYSLPGSDTEGIFTATLSNGSEYKVNYISSSTVIFRSIGNYEGTKRNVEVEY